MGESADGGRESSPMDIPAEESGIEQFHEKEENARLLAQIRRELAYLSVAYRQTMILYYLDGMELPVIAKKLGVSRNTVKQRLFYGRNRIRKKLSSPDSREKNSKKITKEKEKMRDLTLKPVNFYWVGTGEAVGVDPRPLATRRISKNLIYLCKNTPRSAGELSEALGVPMPYVEEELEIQCRGVDGSYGALYRTENGRYRSNIILLEKSEYQEITGILRAYLPQIMEELRKRISKSKERFLSLPYLSRQTDFRYLLWDPIRLYFQHMSGTLLEMLGQEGFASRPTGRPPFSVAAYVLEEGESDAGGFVGCDGIHGKNLCGYSRVYLRNMYSCRSEILSLDAKFYCGHDLAGDSKIQMLLRAVNGLPLHTLTEAEQEIAAKAVECGYLRSDGKTLEPQIVMLPGAERRAYEHALSGAALSGDSVSFPQEALQVLASFIRRHIPAHLHAECEVLLCLVENELYVSLLEACVKEGILTPPAERRGGEGIVAFVEK